MLRSFKGLVAIMLLSLLVTSCKHAPESVNYIPKDASAVTSINLGALGKKIAWNVITGSKIFKDLQKKVPKKDGNDALSGIDNAGIDFLSNIFLYTRTDKRFMGGSKVSAILPLKDAGKWEEYVKKTFPNVEIKSSSSIKLASLTENMFVGWNGNLMIMMNKISSESAFTGVSAEMTTEMTNAFNVPADNCIKSNPNFQKLVSAGHDISVWINYEQMMGQMSEDMSKNMGGVTLSDVLWKESAIACGLDFEKGKITGEMAMYTPKEMKDVYKEFSANNADKDMMERLPKKDIDMMFATHFATGAFKKLLEKANLLGIANQNLTKSGSDMSLDEILSAFTGDIGFVLNGLSIKNEKVSEQFGDQTITMNKQKTSFELSLVIKINNKANFNKLFDKAKAAGMQTFGAGYCLPLPTGTDSLFVIVNDQYAIASNKYYQAEAIANGSNKKDSYNSSVQSLVLGHPMAMFLDVQQGLSGIDIGNIYNSGDSIMYSESKKLLTTIALNGGEFKDDAMMSHMEINFSNKDENCLLTLLGFAMKLSDASNMNKQPSSLNQGTPMPEPPPAAAPPTNL